MESSTAGKHALLVHFSYTGQALKMSDAMAEELTGGGWNVTRAPIEFPEKKYSSIFSRFPMKRPFVELIRVLPGQTLHKTGEIIVPAEAETGGYDLVVIFSPTWWLTTNMPIRSWLKAPRTKAVLDGAKFTDVVVCRRYWGNNHRTVKKMGTKLGGKYVEGIHFQYEGGQIRSLLSLISYMGKGENVPKFLGVKIPPTNLKDSQVEEGRAFARQLA